MEDADREKRPADAQPEDEADREHLRRLQRERQRRLVKAVVVLVILVLLVVFVIQNSDRVPIDFIFVTRRSRLIYVLIVTALLGGVAGYLLGRPGKRTRPHEDEAGKKKSP
jgi:uncharacterized integral membrane protein